MHYECMLCGLKRDIPDPQKFYSLGEGRLLPMHTRNVWCSICRDITVCECLVRPSWRVELDERRLRQAWGGHSYP
jgi:hypothetical protein